MLTICVSTFNRWPDCTKAVYSLLSQACNTNFQIILVDDHSNESIDPPLFEKLRVSGHRYIRHDYNAGLSAARNSAICEAEGHWFSFCDDDDLWPPGLASRLVSAIDSAPSDVGMAIALSENRKKSCGHLFEDYPRLTDLIKAGLTPPGGSQIYRTELLRKVGGYRPEVLSGVDHDLWISLSCIDPKVAVAWGEPAIIGRSPSRDRMTSVEHRRRAGIEKSLAIWRDELCEVFGEPFYRHFVHCYHRYLDYSFLVNSIQKRDYLNAVHRVVRSPWLTLEVVRRRWDRIRGRTRCTLFPEFKED